MYYSAGFVALICLCSLLFLLPNYSAIFSYLVLVMTWSSQRSHLKWSPFTKHQVAFGDSVFQATQLELTGNPLHKRQHLENVLDIAERKKRANMASQCFNGANFLRNIHDQHRYPNLVRPLQPILLLSLICMSFFGPSHKPWGGENHNIFNSVVALSTLSSNAQISISVSEIVIIHRKLALPRLAEDSLKDIFFLNHMVRSSWKRAKGSAHFGPNTHASLDKIAAIWLLDAITNCPSWTPCCCQQQLPW